ncbi:hypothetical protein K1T71_002928 [Dendrolimus kikuchii]|uniref:Uncharacterized protein n=1 Tax=Dendrolimus kikuchii TaxID=765133 RepID=A0ACC1DA91_9NEOP|nr:hypothetical protein K1T71_002928 [Dendrolimus kikuchii]
MTLLHQGQRENYIKRPIQYPEVQSAVRHCQAGRNSHTVLHNSPSYVLCSFLLESVFFNQWTTVISPNLKRRFQFEGC